MCRGGCSRTCAQVNHQSPTQRPELWGDVDKAGRRKRGRSGAGNAAHTKSSTLPLSHCQQFPGKTGWGRQAWGLLLMERNSREARSRNSLTPQLEIRTSINLPLSGSPCLSCNLRFSLSFSKMPSFAPRCLRPTLPVSRTRKYADSRPNGGTCGERARLVKGYRLTCCDPDPRTAFQ